MPAMGYEDFTILLSLSSLTGLFVEVSGLLSLPGGLPLLLAVLADGEPEDATGIILWTV